MAIIGACGTYGKGILARAEDIGVEAVVITRSPHKFNDEKTGIFLDLENRLLGKSRSGGRKKTTSRTKRTAVRSRQVR